MKELISKLTKEELIQLVITLALSMPFKLRKSDLAWAKWLAECERGRRANKEYTQIQKKIDTSNVRGDKLYAQYEAQREAEKADT